MRGEVEEEPDLSLLRHDSLEDTLTRLRRKLKGMTLHNKIDFMRKNKIDPMDFLTDIEKKIL
jgi:hypothetical protein